MHSTASTDPGGHINPPKYGIAALLLANALLALGAMFVRDADTGPIASAFWRMTLAVPVIMLCVLVAAHNRRSLPPLPRPSTAALLILAASGVLFAADLACWHVGLLQTKLANATLLGNSATFIFPIYGFFVARAWPTRMQTFALMLAAAGAVLMIGRSAELARTNLAGDVLSLLAGIFYAVYFIAIVRVRETMTPLSLLAASTFASMPPLLLFAYLLGETIMPTNWTPLVAMALCSQVVGQGLMTYALGRISPLVIGLTLLVQPIVAALIGWLRFDETLGPLDLFGAAMVGLALVMVREAPAGLPGATKPLKHHRKQHRH